MCVKKKGGEWAGTQDGASRSNCVGLRETKTFIMEKKSSNWDFSVEDKKIWPDLKCWCRSHAHVPCVYGSRPGCEYFACRWRCATPRSLVFPSVKKMFTGPDVKEKEEETFETRIFRPRTTRGSTSATPNWARPIRAVSR